MPAMLLTDRQRRTSDLRERQSEAAPQPHDHHRYSQQHQSHGEGEETAADESGVCNIWLPREGGRVLVINEQFCFSESVKAFSLVDA
jgi:hypothetical protein